MTTEFAVILLAVIISSFVGIPVLWYKFSCLTPAPRRNGFSSNVTSSDLFGIDERVPTEEN